MFHKTKELVFSLVLVFFTCMSVVYGDWSMCAANPERTSWVADEVRGSLNTAWYRPIEPYINYKIQIIAADNKLFLSTAKGLYCLDANNGDVLWVYATEVPLGHSPTYYNGKLYIGSYDGTIHCIDATGANEGNKTPGWNPAVALAGFETNPLVVDAGQGVRIYAGSRDGYFYCLDVNTGALIWRYKVGTAIRYSAAIDSNNYIFFAAEDLYAYALRDNGSTYQQMWKSAKMLGDSFSSYWPVVYREWVIFSGGMGYFYNNSSGIQLCWDDKEIGVNIVNNQGTVPGDWAPGTVTMDASAICQYYESKPYRRRVFMLNRSNGQEYTFDSDGDNNPEYVPFGYMGITQSGGKYPPVVGPDDILYVTTTQDISGWTTRGAPVGWSPNTPRYVSRVCGKDIGWAADEPLAYSFGGNVIYMQLCCDREFFHSDVTIPYGQPDRTWNTWQYGGRFSLFPNYEALTYFIPATEPGANPGDGWQKYGTPHGIYGKHGVQNPWIPYNGKVYHHMGNCVIAMHNGAGVSSPLPIAPTVPVIDSAPPVPVSELKARLEEEVQKIVDAGHLRPGLFKSTIGDGALNGGAGDLMMYDRGIDYFHEPGDTIYTLIMALPHLSSTLQQAARTYIQNEMASYPIYNTAHVGFIDGVWRQAAVPPPDHNNMTTYGAQSWTPNNYPWRFPMMAFYHAWKYAELWPSEASTIYSNISSRITVPCSISDSNLESNPHVCNAYLAGYYGYLQLEQMASQPVSTNIQNEYDRLLTLRKNILSIDAPPYPVLTWGGADYNQQNYVGRHFEFLVPEIAQELRNSKLPEIQGIFDFCNTIYPCWFVNGYDGTFDEGSLQHPHEEPIFAARAMLLQEPYEFLLKWLDAPVFPVGDMYYIQNLVHIIEAVPLTATKLNVEASPQVIEAGGTSTSLITARVCDDADRTIANSTAQITFTKTSGGGSLLGTNPINASAGIATITYQSGTSAETVTITATSQDLTQGSVNVGVVVNDPPTAPADLQCNGQTNPTDVSDFTPDLSWTFNDPNAGQGDTQGAYRILVADSQSALNSDNGNMWDTNKVSSAENTMTYDGSGLQSSTQYWWKVMTWDSMDAQGPYSSVATFTTSNIDPRCYPDGIPKPIPGKIEAEDFDNGGEGVAYHDNDAGNNGMQYRTSEGVDIEGCTDTGSGYNIGWTAAGEWLEYTVNVSAPGTYRIDVRVASLGQGGTFHIEFKGADETGALSVPDTGEWQIWQTVSKSGVSLDAGKQIMRFSMDANGPGGFVTNLNYIYLEEESVTPTITVTSPNGAEVWIVNETRSVTWNSGGTIGNTVGIDLSTDGGSNWTSLASGISNDGTETITVPDSQSTTCRIRVQDVGGSPSDTSDNNFTISPPPQAQITVTSPNGGETWTVGSQKVVTWTSQGSVGNAVGISLSTDGGVNWTSLASGTTNDGSETITVPNNPSTACKIRVQDVSGTPSDTSNSNFTILESVDLPSISVDVTILDFGDVEIGDTGTMDFEITNTGGGILSGSISTTKKWIEVSPTSFEDNNVTIKVTVDNNILNQTEGEYTGTISITSNGGNQNITVELTATCVLVKPNPYDPTKGKLTFFGDGIVPGETTIRIYTLGGELIKTLSGDSAKSRVFEGQEVQWDGKNENGEEITNGIYIYVFESPKEQGVGKFTVIRQ